VIRRAVAAATIGVIGLLLPISSAYAITYPPTPPSPVDTVVKKPPKVVKVKDAPEKAKKQAVLSRTGTQSTVPLAAVGTGLLVLGSTLAVVGRRRRSAPPTS